MGQKPDRVRYGGDTGVITGGAWPVVQPELIQQYCLRQRSAGRLRGMIRKPLIYVLLVVLLSSLALRLYKTPHAAAAAEEQAVILKIRLASGPKGNEDEFKRIAKLEDQLAQAVEKASSGDLDGDEFGDGFCTIYLYGPSAERMFASVQHTLKGFRAASGSYVIKRYGKPGSKQDRIEIGNE